MKDKKRLLYINIFIGLAILIFILGLVSIARKPEATAYLGWLFSSTCFIIAFLMIRRRILKKIGR